MLRLVLGRGAARATVTQGFSLRRHRRFCKKPMCLPGPSCDITWEYSGMHSYIKGLMISAFVAFFGVFAGCANQPLDKSELVRFVDKPVDVFIKSRFTGTPKTDKPGAAVFTAY